MLELQSIRLENGGKKIIYRFNCDERLCRYFSKEKTFWVTYDSDVSNVPKSILAIPFLANVLPISWFIGFDLHVDEIDEDYLHSIEKIKQTFARYHSLKKSELHYTKIIPNKIEGQRPIVLFSGGVDSHFSFVKHQTEKPLLVTLHGADIRIADKRQFNVLQNAIADSHLVKEEDRHIVRSNLRDFYSYRVNLLFEDFDWWGRIQHGLAITGLMAPLTWVHHINSVYIASSTTSETDAFWGSTPAVDNATKWAGVSVVHDGYEADRAEKVDALVKYAIQKQSPLPIKVCYSSGTAALNCAHCDKCCRTILLLILAGADPRRFGFQASVKVYDDALANLARGYSSELIKYVWNIVLHKIKQGGKPFIFESEAEEMKKLAAVALAIENNNSRAYSKLSTLKRFRYRLQLQYPAAFIRLANIYRSFR